MNTNEKMLLFAWGCPVYQNTVERMGIMAAYTVDQDVKRMFVRLREKLVILYEEDPKGYEKDYQGVRQEMRGFLLAVDMMEFWMTLRSEEGGRTYEEAYKV